MGFTRHPLERNCGAAPVSGAYPRFALLQSQRSDWPHSLSPIKLKTKPKNEVDERTALGKKPDMGRQDGTEAAALRRVSVAFLVLRRREVQKISANFSIR
jgi:hypothetical protein